MLGYSEKAWPLFHSLEIKSHERDLANIAVLGLRMEGKTDEEVFSWLEKSSLLKNTPSIALYPFLMAGYLDRPPRRFVEAHPEIFRAGANATLLNYVEAAVLLKEGKFGESYRRIDSSLARGVRAYDRIGIALPGLVWSGVQAGRHEAVLTHLEAYRARAGEDFYSALSQAILIGLEGEDVEIVQAFERARGHMAGAKAFPFEPFPWYQLLEALEWLLEARDREVLHGLIRKYSRMVQRLYPFSAWAYAAEALHASSPEARRRALAFALYLDPHSQRANTFPESERDAAMAWFKKNRPLLPERKTRL
jgi:hypothetical protein